MLGCWEIMRQEDRGKKGALRRRHQHEEEEEEEKEDLSSYVTWFFSRAIPLLDEKEGARSGRQDPGEIRARSGRQDPKTLHSARRMYEIRP